MIRVRSLGQSAIEIRRTAIQPDASVVFATLLILCVERGRRVERETLGTLLWPREAVPRRRHNLRQVLYKLRRLGVDMRDNASLSLPKSAVWLDFEDDPENGGDDAISQFSTVTSVEFMPGYAPRFSKPFAVWLDALHERVQSGLRRRLVGAMSDARRGGRWEEVERLARHCLGLDPLNEEATLALAEATALSGAKSKAVALLDAYVAELGPNATDVRVPATILRRRISERMAPRPLDSPFHVQLVGREEIVRALTSAVDDARNGRPSTHVVWGIPGIGKSRVLDEMKRIAVLMGGRVFEQQAAPDDQQTPGLSLLRLLGVMMNAPGALGLSPDALALLRQLTAQATESETNQPLNMGDDVLVRLLVDLERALAYEGLLVMVLDDIHHADVLSQRVLARAQACLTTERVLLLAASVPPPAQGELSTSTLHKLNRLSDAATRKLATSLVAASAANADEEAIDALAAAAGGHPFVLRETVVAWLRDPSATLSTSLDATLESRLASLSNEARDILFTALVLGEHASVQFLMESTTLTMGDAERGLTELEREQIVQVVSDGSVRTHSLWLRWTETLVPTGQGIARRHRIAHLLEDASTHAFDTAELLLASAAHYQKLGDTARASHLLAKSGAALSKRALAPGAYAAYSRAAALTPASEDFERRVTEALFAGWEARLAEEVGPLLHQFGARLQRSSKLTDLEKSEIAVISIEVQHAHLAEESDGVSCRKMLEGRILTPHQKLRVAIAGAQAAEHDYDVSTVSAIAELVGGVPLEDAFARHLGRQIAMVHAVSQGRLTQARALADEVLVRINEDLAPKDRCRPLLNARIPFWFDCDFERVEAIIHSARGALSAYACTVDALRTEDIYATHCLDKMRLDEAEGVIEMGADLVREFGYGGLVRNFAELQIRLKIARGDVSVVNALVAALSRNELHSVSERHRTFALCNAAVGLARTGDTEMLADVVAELAGLWDRIAKSCPFDYACVALAIGLAAAHKRRDAAGLLDRYSSEVRIARHAPSPFVLSLASEFGVTWP
jgi:DNA-binding SARP family transcriptional activator